MSTTATTKTITSGGATTTTTTTVTATKEAAAAADDWALPKKGIKLYYWPATGLAEAIRLMLADNGIEWEDVTFDRSDANKAVGVYGSPTSLGAHMGTVQCEFTAGMLSHMF